MSDRRTIPVEVKISRDRADQPWQTRRWRVVGVALARGRTRRIVTYRRQIAAVTGLSRAKRRLMGLLSLDLSELAAYRVNLGNGAPTLYIAIDEKCSTTVALNGVTASPFALDPFEKPDMTLVEKVPMPAEIVAMVRDFVEANTRGPDRSLPLTGSL